VIGVSFIFEMIFAQPEMDKVLIGLIPTMPNQAALYIAIGIIGATVMPQFILHSSLVQTRKFDRTKEE
jgi:manganese transport protein